MLTSIVLRIFSDFVLFYHAFQVKSTQFFYFDTYFPCISNCWARPRGLQKIVYFHRGSTCRKVWEPLSYGLACSLLNANKKLLTACQPWNHSNHHKCMGLTCYRCHGELSRTCVPNLSCDYFKPIVFSQRQNYSSSYIASQGKIDTAQKMHVGHRNTLSDSFRKRIVWFQRKQDSDQKQISFFKNRIGSDSKNPLSDHLLSTLGPVVFWACIDWLVIRWY